MGRYTEIVSGNPLILLYVTVIISSLTFIVTLASFIHSVKKEQVLDYKKIKGDLLDFSSKLGQEEKEINSTEYLLYLRLLFEEIEQLKYGKHVNKLRMIAIDHFFNLQRIKKDSDNETRYNHMMQDTLDSDLLTTNMFKMEPVQGTFSKLNFEKKHNFFENGEFKNFVFENCELNGTSFANAKIKKIFFNDSMLEDIDFTTCVIDEMNFEGSTLKDVFVKPEDESLFNETDYKIDKVSDINCLKINTLEITHTDIDISKKGRIFETPKISQKLYVQTRYLFNSVKKSREILRKDIDNDDITNIHIKESMNHSHKSNTSERVEYTSWFTVNKNLIHDGAVFYFVIKINAKNNETIAFRFTGVDIKEKLIGNVLPDINGYYNVYIAKRVNDSFFVNDRNKQNPLYLDEANIINDDR